MHLRLSCLKLVQVDASTVSFSLSRHSIPLRPAVEEGWLSSLLYFSFTYMPSQYPRLQIMMESISLCPRKVFNPTKRTGAQVYAAAGSATYFAVPSSFKSTHRVAGPRRTRTNSTSLAGGGTRSFMPISSCAKSSSSLSKPDLE